MPLPSGGWKAIWNGAEGTLAVETTPQKGVVKVFPGFYIAASQQPTVYPTEGFWDEGAQRLTFTLQIPYRDGELPFVGLVEGYLMRSPTNPEVGQDQTATLVGTVQVSRPHAEVPMLPWMPSARRNTFGWYAQIVEVI